MRYAILSDVHGNLQALNAVLTDAYSLGTDKIISLGDLVGYGPDPAEVLEIAYARVAHFVTGNHDAVIAGMLRADSFNDTARRLIEWTGQQLDDKAAAFLAQVPYVLTDPLFRCSHGSPSSPGTFTYLLEDDDALAAWQACPEQILFVGHSHVPGMHVLGNSGTPHWLEPTDFATESHKRYIVNVGSVGQPRDGDVRASYCLLDTDRREVWFRRVPFDLDAFRQALQTSTAPTKSSLFLRLAEVGTPPPLREMLDFHPLAEDAVQQEDVTEAQLHEAVHAARRWRTGAAVLLLLLLLLVTAVAWTAWENRRDHAPAYAEFAAAERRVLPLPPLQAQCLPLSQGAGVLSAGNPPTHWTVRVTSPQQQQIRMDPAPDLDTAVIQLTSETPSPLSLQSRAIAVVEGMRFKMAIRGRYGESFDGHVAMSLVEECDDGSSRLIVHYPIENLRRDRWRYCHKSSPPEGLPKDGTLRWILEGEFTGVLEIHSPEVVRIQ